MPDVSSAWKDAGERFAALGSSLKAHFEERRDGETEREGEKATADAADKLRTAVQDAFEALGAAAKDPAVKDDVRRVGQSLAGALSATFAEVSQDLRRMADTTGPRGEPTAGEPTAGEPTAGEPMPPTRDDEPPKVEPWGTP